MGCSRRTKASGARCWDRKKRSEKKEESREKKEGEEGVRLPLNAPGWSTRGARLTTVYSFSMGRLPVGAV